jgi:hypothetical protein
MTATAPLRSADGTVGEKACVMMAIWKSACAGRFAPKRREITLARVRGLAPWLWIAEVAGGGEDYLFRLTGERIVQFFGRSFAGVRLSDLGTGLFALRTKQAFAHCIAQKAPYSLSPVEAGYKGRELWEMETLVLPLSDDGDTVDRLIGVLDFRFRGNI